MASPREILTSLIIDFDGKRPSVFARRAVAERVETGLLFLHDTVSGVSKPTEYSSLWEFSLGYFQRTGRLITDTILQREIDRSDLSVSEKGLLSKTLLGLRRVLDVREAEWDYAVAFLREEKARHEFVDTIRRGMDRYEKSPHVADAIDFVRRSLQDIGQALSPIRVDDDVKSIGELMVSPADTPIRTVGRLCGLPALDKTMRGFANDELIVPVARTNSGKSMISLFMLIHDFKMGGNPFLVSKEMNWAQIQPRIIAHLTGVTMNRIRFSEFKSNKQRKIVIDAVEFMKEFCARRFNFVPPTRCETAEDVFNVVDDHAARTGVAPTMLLADYLNLFDVSTRRGYNDGQWTKQKDVAQEFKALPLRLGCPVIAPAQASVEAVKARSRKGQVDDVASLFAYASAIAAAPDTILLFYPDELAPPEPPKDAQQLERGTQGIVHGVVAKGRNIPTGWRFQLYVEWSTLSIRSPSRQVDHDSKSIQRIVHGRESKQD